MPAPDFGRSAMRWLATWWQIVRLGALILLLLATPSSWKQPWRRPIAHRIWTGSGPSLVGFSLLSTLVSLVIMRIVLVTAQSYGLSQYALEMVVRVLVLELLPLSAALFVALRVGLPFALQMATMRNNDELALLRKRGVDVLRMEIVPRAIGVLFAVLLLAAISSVICLVLAYLLAHGLSPWGLDNFTRLIGRIFTPAITLVFVLKTVGMALAVAVIPLGSALHDPQLQPQNSLQSGVELQGLVRLFAALLVIEVLSLVGNYV